MTSRRLAKVSEAIREQVSTAILFEIKDPRVKNVTVISAEASPDLRSAKVYVSIMGDEKAQSLSMHGLNSARGFIQAKLAERLQLRYTPVLHFVLDMGVKRSIEASRLLREALGDSADSSEPADEFHDDDDDDVPPSQSETSSEDDDVG